MKNILVVGSINMDLIITTPYVPQMGETIHGEGFEVVCGGKGANQAVAAARLGGSVKMIGCVGTDVYGKPMKENLENNGIDASGVDVVSGASGVAMITICDGDNFIILEKGANGKVTKEIIDKNKAAFEWADVVVFQFEIPQETILYAAQIAKSCGAKVLLNPAPMKPIDKELLGNVDILVTNENETQQLLGYTPESYEKAIEDIKKMGIDQVIITLGGDGCVYNDGDMIKAEPAIKTKVVDTTAAGDCFIGGLCAGVCDGMSLEQAVKYATKASSIAVGIKGAATSIPTKQTVMSL